MVRTAPHSTDGALGPDGSENQEVFWSPPACLTLITIFKSAADLPVKSANCSRKRGAIVRIVTCCYADVKERKTYENAIEFLHSKGSD